MSPEAPRPDARPPADGREWHDEARAARYRRRFGDQPWWRESERALVEHLPERVSRFLDLGTGDGRLIELVRRARPGAEAVGLDFSPPMLAAAAERLTGAAGVELLVHDLSERLPDLGAFDAVVSGFAIHHLEDARKRALYREVHALLRPGGAFLNLEHVASPTARLHEEFFLRIGEPLDEEDPSDRLAPAWRQVEWLAEIGFTDADCHWKWRELALIGGRVAQPGPSRPVSEARAPGRRR